jgi:hypothetical protein
MTRSRSGERRRCSDCGNEKPIAEFHIVRSWDDEGDWFRRHDICKTCIRARNAAGVITPMPPAHQQRPESTTKEDQWSSQERNRRSSGSTT